MKSTIGKIRIWLPPDTPLRIRLRIWWRTIVFVWKYDHASPLIQSLMMDRLSKGAPGVQVTITEKRIP